LFLRSPTFPRRIVEIVATRPLRLDPPLRDAVERAREALAASERVHPKPGRYRSHLDDQERAAVARIISNGTYRRLAESVAAADPEIADQ
jgi:hypothetical protein